MTYWELVHTEEYKGYEIRLSLTNEIEQPDWDFESEEDRQDTLRRIDQGTLLWFVAKVSAHKVGIELGADFIGGCCYESVAAFLESGGYYDDLRSNAVEFANAKIKALTEANP